MASGIFFACDFAFGAGETPLKTRQYMAEHNQIALSRLPATMGQRHARCCVDSNADIAPGFTHTPRRAEPIGRIAVLSADPLGSDSKRDGALIDQPLNYGFRFHWPRDVVSLRVVAAEMLEGTEFDAGLDPFCDHNHAEPVPEFNC